MKLIAIETVFIFILSLIAAIVFITFFFDIRKFIIIFFQEKQPKEYFEIEIISRENFSQNFLLELSLLCAEKVNKSKLKIENFTCYYLYSNQKFENIKISDEIEFNNIKINFELFDNKKRNVLIVYNKKINKVFFIN